MSRRTSVAKPRKTAKKNPKARPTKKLTSRQEKIKKLLVASRGMISNAEIAEKLGIHPSQVWEEKRKIAFFQEPGRIEGWDHVRESEEIIKAIDFYEGAIELLAAEYRGIVDYERKRQKEIDEAVKRGERKGYSKHLNPYNTLNLKLGLMNGIRALRLDLSQFMIQIGLIREAPKRIIFEDETGAIGDTLADMNAGIKEVRGQLAELRKARRETEGK